MASKIGELFWKGSRGKPPSPIQKKDAPLPGRLPAGGRGSSSTLPPVRSYLNQSGQPTAPLTRKRATTTTIDPEFDQELGDLLGMVTLPEGFVAFTQALNALSQYIADEGTRFKAAFDTATKTSTLTKEGVRSALQAQQVALKDRQQKFLQELEEDAASMRTEHETELREIGEQKTSLEDQIGKLQRQVEDLTERENELNGANARVDNQKEGVIARFNSAFEPRLQTITDMLGKIAAYLGVPSIQEGER